MVVDPVLVAVIVGAVLCAFLLMRLLRRGKLPSHQEQAACPSCGWRGVVSRYAGRCPSCNAPLGEQKARRRPG